MAEFKKKVRKAPTKRPPINTMKIDERVWEKAYELSGGKLSRLEAKSETEMIVHNNSNWRK